MKICVKICETISIGLFDFGSYKFMLVLVYLFQKVNYDDFESPKEKKNKACASKDEEDDQSETEDEKENETESEDEIVQEISEYDKLRLKNIEENRRVLM